MPGRTPHKAIQDFLEPLEEAVAVLDGFTKLFVFGVERGGAQADSVYAWTLNEGSGLDVGQAGHFYAEMKFKVVSCAPERYGDRYRVKTLAYRYKLVHDNEPRWMMHWHPDSNPDPHMHVRPALKEHQPSARMTFERAIMWCMASEAPRSCTLEEAITTLQMIEWRHTLHRSWSQHPDEPRTA